MLLRRNTLMIFILAKYKYSCPLKALMRLCRIEYEGLLILLFSPLLYSRALGLQGASIDLPLTILVQVLPLRYSLLANECRVRVFYLVSVLFSV